MDGSSSDSVIIVDKSPARPPNRTSSGATPLSPSNRKVSKGPLDRFIFRGKAPAAVEKPKKISDAREPEIIVPDTTDCIDLEVNRTRSAASSSTNQNVVIEETVADADSSSGGESDVGMTVTDSDSGQENSGKRSALGVKTEGLTASAQKNRRRLSLDEKKAREAEMERKKAEREKKREEKEKQRLELENAKKERAEARQKKLEAMKEAEREKEERRKQTEKEKEEKEERRKQIEREKEERRKHKEVEKQLAEEAKKRKLEEEQAKKSKAALMFKKHFFVVQGGNKDASANESADTSYKSFGPFKMFQLRPNQRLAPICRLARDDRESAKTQLDKALGQQDDAASLFKDWKSGRRKIRSSGPTYPQQDDVVIRLDDNTRSIMKAKLLQFTEDIRPPYFGTWRKRSTIITGRKPFQPDTATFDYECDSAADWEEPEDGEDIVSSSKESGDEDTDAAKSSDEEEDGFIVPHGYLSTDEEEAREEEDQAVLAPTDVKLKNRVQDSYELGFKKLAKSLRPIFFGPELVDSGRPLPIDLTQFHPLFYEPVPADAEAILCGEVVVPDPEPAQPANTGTSSSTVPDSATAPISAKKSKLSTGEGGATTGQKVHKKPVPEEGYPALIRYVHGNSAGIGRLIEGFIESFAKEPVVGCEVSKRQVERQIFAIAERVLKPERHPQACWYVRDDMLAKYNLTDLPVPNVSYSSPAVKRPRKNKDQPTLAATLAGTPTAAAATGASQETTAKVPPSTPTTTVPTS